MSKQDVEHFERVLTAPYIHLEGGGSYFVERDGPVLRLFFEGSNGRLDWRNNFDFPAKPYRDMADRWYAHRGFLRVWKEIEPRVADQIADPTVAIVEVVGYSHGAAVALLCHEYVRFHRPDVMALGTGYGCPRVVWGWLSKKVRERFKGFYVVRNGRDLVTHLPPALFGYRHEGLMIETGRSVGPIKDHSPEAYKAALQEWVEEVLD